MDHAIFNAPVINQNEVECDIVSPLNTHNAAQQSPTGELEVILYHIKGWPTAGPPPAASLLNVMEEVGAIQKKKNRPVLVMCE